MVAILRREDQNRLAGGTFRFEGREHGAPVSFFLVRTGVGGGSSLHVHPYAETWVMREGEAEFTIGDRRLRAAAGDIVVAPANVPHRFVNVGAGSLDLVCIHPVAAIEQRNLSAIQKENRNAPDDLRQPARKRSRRIDPLL